mmetsp:Transcript_67797/g.187999  ORF Transcript_67797/g.187999 Transcript_67797/m.187999 type:complete len:207 (+) Transcript_67797:335-955(+)
MRASGSATTLTISSEGLPIQDLRRRESEAARGRSGQTDKPRPAATPQPGHVRWRRARTRSLGARRAATAPHRSHSLRSGPPDASAAGRRDPGRHAELRRGVVCWPRRPRDGRLAARRPGAAAPPPAGGQSSSGSLCRMQPAAEEIRSRARGTGSVRWAPHGPATASGRQVGRLDARPHAMHAPQGRHGGAAAPLAAAARTAPPSRI